MKKIYFLSFLCLSAFTLNAQSLKIGENYQGGKIAYILQQGDPGYVAGQTHGLIVALNDLNQTAWHNKNKTLGTSNNFGAGLSNTNLITAFKDKDLNAASLCRSYSMGEYKDWYLPSKDELIKIYQNKDLIGSFTTDKYWSSSETGTKYAFCQDFGDGRQVMDENKGYRNAVRPVRSF